MHKVFFSWSKQNGGLMMECGFRQCGWDSLPSGDGSMRGVTLLRSPVYPSGTQLPFWGVLCAHVTQLPCWRVLCIHVGHSYSAEGFCVPMWDTVTLLRVSCVPTWETVTLLRVPVYPCGTQLPCCGVLCAHMGDSYPAEGGLRMHTRHSLIVILLLLQRDWIWVKNHFLKQPEAICIEDTPSEDVTEERNSNFSSHSKTGSQGRHRSIRCGSQTDEFWLLPQLHPEEVPLDSAFMLMYLEGLVIWSLWLPGRNAPLSGQSVPLSPFMAGGQMTRKGIVSGSLWRLLAGG